MSVVFEFDFIAFTRCVGPASAPDGARITETVRGLSSSTVTLSYPYRPGSATLSVNGIQQWGVNQTGERTITLDFVPVPADVITVSYVVQFETIPHGAAQ
jgi:hypothetical protein